jgi:hypothetical protein
MESVDGLHLIDSIQYFQSKLRAKTGAAAYDGSEAFIVSGFYPDTDPPTSTIDATPTVIPKPSLYELMGMAALARLMLFCRRAHYTGRIRKNYQPTDKRLERLKKNCSRVAVRNFGVLAKLERRMRNGMKAGYSKREQLLYCLSSS